MAPFQETSGSQGATRVVRFSFLRCSQHHPMVFFVKDSGRSFFGQSLEVWRQEYEKQTGFFNLTTPLLDVEMVCPWGSFSHLCSKQKLWAVEMLDFSSCF